MSDLAPWVLALALSGAVALVVTPIVARRARGRTRWSPLTSSAGLCAGVAIVVPFLAGADTGLIVGLVAALGLWAVGTLVDRGRAHPRLGFVALGAATLAVTAAGLRVPVTGFGAGDVVATLIGVLGAAAAWRSGLTRDGLLVGWAAAIAVGAGVLGGLAGQDALASCGAVLVGASIGFLAYWLPPTAARLRTGGAMPLGFLAVVVALDAQPTLGAPRDAAIPLILLALPLLDTTFVVVARLRGWTVDARAAGLVARLRLLGLPPSAVSLLLVGTEIVLGAVAVFAGRGVLPLGVAAGAAVVAVVALTVAAIGADLPGQRARSSARLALLALGIVAVLVLLSAPSALALLRARELARSGAESATRGLSAAQHGDSAVAESAFLRAEDEFTQAQRRLADPLVSGGLAVPVLSPNLRAARALMSVGIDLSRAGRRLASSADPQKLRIRDGTLPFDELARLEPELASTAGELGRADARLRDINRTFLVGPVEDAITKLERRLATAVHDSRMATEAARVLPAVFGGAGSRRYFLAVQNNAEARAQGGFIGNWAIITATNGKLTIDRFEPVRVLNPRPNEFRTLRGPADYRARYEQFEPQRLWQNVNMSPDLPTTASAIHEMLPETIAGPVDGVVTIDPVGLSHMLRLTGPVRVAGWSSPITADNVVDATLHQAYVVYAHDNNQRDQFLGDVAEAVWSAFTHGDLGNPSRLLRELGQASLDKHLSVWLADKGGQQLVHRARADASLPPPGDDLTLVTTQNEGENKLDTYLRRTVHYHVKIVPDPDGHHVQVVGRLEVALKNNAPASGLPQEVLGPNRADIGAGVNRSYVTLYSPLQRWKATLDGAPTGFGSQRELGYWADAKYLDLDPGSTQHLDVSLAGKVRLGPDGRYRLHVVRQPLLVPDHTEVDVEVPKGWRLVGARGLRQIDARHARYVGKPDRDLVLSVDLKPDSGHSLFDRLQAGG